MLYLEPLLPPALVIWLARGMPRPPGLVTAGVAISVGLLITIPFESFFNVSALNDTFGLVPFLRLSEGLNGGVSKARTLIGIGAICAAILFATVPRTVAAWAVPIAWARFWSSLRAASGRRRRTPRGRPPRGRRRSELDRPRRGPDKRVEFLYTTDIDPDPHILWQTEFWNRSLRRVFGVTAPAASIRM